MNKTIGVRWLYVHMDMITNRGNQFEKTYPLALPGRKDRTRPLLDAAKATNLNLTLLAAVRGMEIEKDTWPEKWIENDHVIGEIGCLTSHVRTWKRRVPSPS